MNFEAHIDLIDLIHGIENRLKRNCFFTLIYSVAYILFMYFKNGKPEISYAFVFCMFLLVFLFGFFQYSQIAAPSKTITTTVIEVQLLDEYIVVKTMPYKVFFFINKPVVELKFKLAETKIQKFAYPLKQIYDLDETLKLIDRDKVAYIILDYFDKELEHKIIDIY